MARENAYDKASRLLAEARVTLMSVRPEQVHAQVRGTDRFHDVYWSDYHGWRCTCIGLKNCSHLMAVQRVVTVPPGKDHA